MPGFPSSQTKLNQTDSLQQRLKTIQGRLQTTHVTLSTKVKRLRATKSDDPIQQLQSDIISDLYDLVRELQLDLFPSLLGLPDVGSVRDGLNSQGKTRP
jgi:hypothetical protein